PDVNHDGLADGTTPAKLWSNGNDAGCTITNDDGYCDVGPLVTGTYVVHEETAPPGTNKGGLDTPVTVTKGTRVEVDVYNTLNPLQIGLEKGGPDFAHVGDVYNYTFTVATTGPDLHAITLEDQTVNGCTGAISGPTGDTGGDGVLKKGEVWVYQCSHTVLAGDPDPFVNHAKVTGTDAFNRTKSATAEHQVDILHPVITLD